MTFAELIREARERKGWSQADLGRAMGVTRSTVTQWESGETAPGRKRWAKLEQVLGLAPGTITPFSVSGVRVLDAPDYKVVNLPLYNMGAISMGADGELKFGASEGTEPVEETLGTTCFAAKVADEAMAPLYRMGDVIIVERGAEPSDNEAVVAGTPGKVLMLRVYNDLGTNSRGRHVFELRSTNPDYPTIPMESLAGLEIVGVVVEHRRRTRRPVPQLAATR